MPTPVSAEKPHLSENELEPTTYNRPKGLYGLYSHPVTQVTMLGLVFFTCPGLFNALNGLGAGGQIDSEMSANSNSALFAIFAVSAFFAGAINNKIGARLTLFMGSLGYGLYIAAYLAMNIHSNAGPFVFAAGAILGLCAGLLWTAQGSLMLSYPTEIQKGRFISIFWTIYNLGAVIGAAASLAINFQSNENSASNSTYITLLVLTLGGSLIPLIMVDPQNVIRTDGTRVTTTRHPSWRAEIHGLWVAVRDDPLIALLCPMSFASNWFYTWQFNAYNAALFNIQARSLNNLVYWIAQIIGSISMGLLLDHKTIKRRARAFAGCTVLFVLMFVVHIWAYFYQKEYTRTSLPPDAPKMGVYDEGYVARIWLYFFFGAFGAMWQTTAYWIIGAMSNDPAKLAYFSGLYTSIRSAGSASSWRVDGKKTPYMNMFISTWILLAAALVVSFPMIYLRIKDTTKLPDEKTIARNDDDVHIRNVDDKE